MKIEKLDDIVLRLQSKNNDNNVIKRAIAKAAKGFKSRSSNDVQHRTFLAGCLYAVGEVEDAKAILHALDVETDSENDRADLAGELAISRLLLAHIYSVEGNACLRDEILKREGIRRSMNLENIGITHDRKYKNGLQEDLANAYEGMKQLKYDSSPKREQQSLAFECYIYAVMYTERLGEIRNKISKEDEAHLAEALVFFKDKFSHHLQS